MAADRPVEGSTLADFVGVARRRKWIIVQATAIVPIVAVVLSLRQADLYESRAEVLLSRQNLAATLAGVPDVYATQDAQRYAATQAFLARAPRVARRVVKSEPIAGLTAAGFLGSSSVSAAPDADLLSFRVIHPDPAIAARLANAYANEFTRYRRSLDTSAMDLARNEILQRQKELRKAGKEDSEAYGSLQEREHQLLTVMALQRSNTFLARPAGGATKIQPRPKRDAILGLGLGFLLGLGLAFLRETLDTRIRSAEEIGHRLGVPLLGRLAAPPKKLGDANKLVMLADPYSVQAEAFRMLRTNLELANLELKAKTIMITSAVEQEGKTTTAANLAVALARAGRRVCLVDLDLRRPAVDRFFAVPPRPGIIDVAVGDVELDEALVTFTLDETPRNGGGADSAGLLQVLPAGQVPPNPGEFSGNAVVSRILATLKTRCDILLIDTPPVLHVVDAIALSTRVDGILVVAKLAEARRSPIKELRRLLETSPAATLGYVVTGAEFEADLDVRGYSTRAYTYGGDREYVS